MNKISFNGYNENSATFTVAEGSALKKGDFVALSANKTVTAAAANSDIIGYCVDVNDGFATVQTQGYISAEMASGESIALGYSSVSVNAAQKVIASTTARKVLVVDVDTTANTIGFIL